VFENEAAEEDVMRRPPRDTAAQLFGGATLWLALLQGLGVLAVVMGAYVWANSQLDEPEARAFAFTTLVIANLAMIFADRSRTGSLLASLRAPNPILWIVTGLTLIFLGLSLYQPFLADLFRFAALPPFELAVAFGLGLAGVVGVRLFKRVIPDNHASNRAGGRR
jgi:Ca2+-transporting ATPase